MRREILFFLLLLFFWRLPAFAQEADEMQIQAALAQLDTDAVNHAAGEMDKDMDMDFSALLQDILSGSFDFSFAAAKERLLETAFGEFHIQARLLAQLLLVILLSAILKQLSDSFQGKTVGEMGFYICYMVLVVVIISSFYEISRCVVERMNGICKVFGAMLPIFLTLCASSGNLTQTAMMGSAIVGGSAALSTAVNHILIPAILLAVSLELTDHIAERPILGKFAELLRQCIGWGMKATAMAFMLLLSLQKAGGGAINGLAAKTAKIAVGTVPIVGDVMGGAVEAAAAVVSTLRSGTLAAAAIVLVLLCLPLLIKLVVILLTFKVTAAAAEFICEERLVECISAAGDYTGLLLGVLFLGEGMFLFSALLLLGGL